MPGPPAASRSEPLWLAAYLTLITGAALVLYFRTVARVSVGSPAVKRGFSSVASLAQRVPAAKRLRAKIAISIDGELAREADALAREMGVTRSGLYAMALREFIRRRESAVLLEKLNDVYGEPGPEDEPLLRGIKRRNRRLLGEEER